MSGSVARRQPASLRGVARIVHRYVGLFLATFLLVAGLTGSVLAFYTELDGWLNPDLFHPQPPYPGAALLDGFTLLDRYKAQEPRAKSNLVVLERVPGRAVEYWQGESEDDYQQVFLDPYTGKILGSRKWGDLSEGKRGILTFLYRLHSSLALGEVGAILFGAIALLWTFDSFVGLYLTFPITRGASPRIWFKRWGSNWWINTSKLFSLIFSWHRASGLWVWLMLLVFGWSAVALNLSEWVYEPVMHGVFGAPPDTYAKLAKLARPRITPRIAPRQALEVGRAQMHVQAEARRFEILTELALDYDPSHGSYVYTVDSSRDLDKRSAETSVAFDGDNGAQLGFHAQTGEHAGSTFTTWLIALHFGALRSGGIAYRSFVCAMGPLVVLLSISGVWIWWKKRTRS